LKFEINEESIEDSSNISKFEENKSKMNIYPLNKLNYLNYLIILKKIIMI
jgi:hypothetical protein